MKFDKFFEMSMFVVLFLVLFRFIFSLFVVRGFWFFFCLFLFVLLFFLSLFFRDFLFSFFSRFVSWFDGLARNRRCLLVTVFFVLLFFLFIFLRTTTTTIDASALLSNLENNYLDKPYVLNILFFIFVDFCLSFFGFSSVVTFLVVDAFCGVLFVYVSFLLSGRLFRGEKRFLFFLMFLAVGSFKIFFGDVEVYAPVVVLLLVFIFFSVEYLLGRRSVFFSGFSFVLLFLFHVHAVFFIPTLFVLPILKKFICKKKTNVKKELFLISKVVFIPIVCFVLIFSFDSLFLNNHFISRNSIMGNSDSKSVLVVDDKLCPYCFCSQPFLCGYEQQVTIKLFSNENPSLKEYFLFSPKNVYDKFNALKLSGPLFFLMLITFFIFFKFSFSKRFFKDSFFIFFTICLFFMFVRIFIMTFWSIQKDWNSFIMFGPTISLWTGYVLLKYFSFDKELLVYVFWSLFAISVSVVNDVLFII